LGRAKKIFKQKGAGNKFIEKAFFHESACFRQAQGRHRAVASMIKVIGL